ncbi:MAG: hypothetical protein HOO06_13970 [Bdellovibrionaceae bacterium]|jgi:hypothetical protein|nr:hypothetical protein [Pseudobdellovibrionaceae bacterium]
MKFLNNKYMRIISMLALSMSLVHCNNNKGAQQVTPKVDKPVRSTSTSGTDHNYLGGADPGGGDALLIHPTPKQVSQQLELIENNLPYVFNYIETILVLFSDIAKEPTSKSGDSLSSKEIPSSGDQGYMHALSNGKSPLAIEYKKMGRKKFKARVDKLINTFFAKDNRAKFYKFLNDLDIQDDGPCKDEDGNVRDGSIHFLKEKKQLCINSESLSQKVYINNVYGTTQGMVVHEIVHASYPKESNEEFEAQFLEAMTQHASGPVSSVEMFNFKQSTNNKIRNLEVLLEVLEAPSKEVNILYNNIQKDIESFKLNRDESMLGVDKEMNKTEKSIVDVKASLQQDEIKNNQKLVKIYTKLLNDLEQAIENQKNRKIKYTKIYEEAIHQSQNRLVDLEKLIDPSLDPQTAYEQGICSTIKGIANTSSFTLGAGNFTHYGATPEKLASILPYEQGLIFSVQKIQIAELAHYCMDLRAKNFGSKTEVAFSEYVSLGTGGPSSEMTRWFKDMDAIPIALIPHKNKAKLVAVLQRVIAEMREALNTIIDLPEDDE